MENYVPDEVPRTMSDDAYIASITKLNAFSSWVALEAGTERPNTNQKFVNGYRWDTTEEGTYSSAVSGVALFSSKAKYDSGTGWPSFSAPIDSSRIFERTDPKDVKRNPQEPKLWRRQILDRASMTHLGHVFPDPKSPSGRRFRLNAAILSFQPGSSR